MSSVFYSEAGGSMQMKGRGLNVNELGLLPTRLEHSGPAAVPAEVAPVFCYPLFLGSYP